jgi:ATP-dependent RNA helicase DHX37/DHR1
MTDGILLREIQTDFLLSRYSAIVIDEAHERTMNTDILLGLLCRIVPLRRQVFEEGEKRGAPIEDRQARSPLKVIIMSATLRVADFTSNRRMFPAGPPPVISIGSRQHPVTVHFNRRTPITGYIQEAFKKVVKIHTTLPSGGVLVFVTGQQEVEYLCNKLRTYFEQRLRRLKRGEADPVISESEIADETAALELGGDEEAQDHLPEDERTFQPPTDAALSADAEGDDTEDGTVALDVDDGSESEEDAVLELVENMMKADEVGLPSRGNLKQQRREAKASVKAAALEEMDFLVLPLYSMLPPKQQMKVFEAVPANTRLIVVATNIAETSLTIPGISYVVDAGRVKNKVYDKASGMSRYKIDWIAQSAANQRAGRAGRTGPGHCYRLYSSAVFQELPDFPTPDILMIPIEEVVLQMKNMGIGKIDSFPFPTPPDVHSLKIALNTLINIGAVDVDKKTKEQTITPLGKSMSRFPVHPRFAKMLILGHQGQCINYIVSIVACLAVGDPFLVDANPASVSKDRSELWKPFASQTSDMLSALSAIGAYEFADDKEGFCHKFKLHSKTMKEIRMLRWQLTNLLNQQKSAAAQQIDFESRPPPPSRDQKVLLRQIIAAGFVDHIARRIPDTNEAGEEISGKWKYVTGITSQEAHIHPSSFLYKIRPEWVVYKELIETNRVYLKGVTAVLLDWMTSLGPWLCSGMDEIVEAPGPRYDSEHDKIRGFVQPSFIHKDWMTTKLQVDLKGLDVFKYFARFLLEGQICLAIKPFARKMVAKPSIIVKQWAQHKIAAIVQPLLDHKIDSKQKLLARWQKDPKFLLSAVLLWLDPGEHANLAQVWPPTN